MKKLLCGIFGHNWLYGDFKGIQGQPTARACQRCEKVQRFYGEMTYWEGTFGQFWYGKKLWRSQDEQKRYEKTQKKLDNKFRELTHNTSSV